MALVDVDATMSLAFRHLILNYADDGHEDCSSDAAASDIAKDGRQVHRTAASFMAAPATLPPTAPLITSIMRLMMFIGLALCCARACIDWLGLRTGHTAKSESPSDKPRMARTQWSHACDEGHAAIRLARPTEV